MEEGIKPGVIMLIAGGALVFLTSIFEWVDSNASRTEIFGITWLITLVIGGGIAVAVALEAFANVTLPTSILGFSRNQLFVSLSFAAFLITFGLFVGGREREVWLLLSFVGAAVMVAGGYMEMQSEDDTGAGGTPTQF